MCLSSLPPSLPKADARAERRLSTRAAQLQAVLPQSVGVELCGALGMGNGIPCVDIRSSNHRNLLGLSENVGYIPNEIAI